MRKNVKNILNSILSLLEEAESYEFHKQNLLKSLNALFEEYQQKRYSFAEYQKMTDDLLKSRTKEYWVGYYDTYIYSLMKQIEPLLSQIIYLVYNDNSISRLKVSKGFFAPRHDPEAEKQAPKIHHIPAAHHVSLEEDKDHELTKLKGKDEGKLEFVELEREPLIGRPKSSVKERFERDIGKIRGIRQSKPMIDIDLPEIKDKRPSLLARMKARITHHFERRSVSRRKDYISKELDRITKPSLYSRFRLAIGKLRPQLPRSAEAVKVSKPSLIQRLSGSISSAFARKEKKEFMEPVRMPKRRKEAVPARPKPAGMFSRLRLALANLRPRRSSGHELMKPVEKTKIGAMPRKAAIDSSDLDRLAAKLDIINESKADLRVGVGTPKKSFRMKIDLFLIKMHAASRRRKAARRQEMAAKTAKVKEPLKAKEAKEAVQAKPALGRVTAAFRAAFQGSVSAALGIADATASAVKALGSMISKPKPAEEPGKARLPEAGMKAPAPIVAPKEKQPFFGRISSYISTSFTNISARVRSFLFVKPPLEAEPPLSGKAFEKKPQLPSAQPSAEKPALLFRFSLEYIRQAYTKMMEREKKFVAKEGSLGPSMEMQSLKEKIKTVTEEEDVITPRLLREEVQSIQKIIEEKKKYKIYKPSFIGSFANATIRRFTFYLIEKYPAFFKTLYDNLRLANIKLLSNTYVNIMLLTTMVVTAISSVLFFAFFMFTDNPFIVVIPKTFIMAILCGCVTFMIFYSYPQMKAKTREKDINTNLPFAINHISAVSGSGVPPTKMFRLIMESGEYGDIAVEIEKIVEYVELFGYDLLTAIRSVAMTTPSISFKEFLEGMVSTIESGGDLSVYLKEKTSEAILSYELERQKYTETIATYSDVYTGILIAAPLFFIVALSMVSMLGGSIAGMDVKYVIVLGAYVVIPVLNIMFIVLLELTQPEM